MVNEQEKNLANAGKVMAGMGAFIVIINYLQINIIIGLLLLIIGACFFVKGDEKMHPERYAGIKKQLENMRKANEEECRKRGTTPEDEYLTYRPPELPSLFRVSKTRHEG